MTLFLHKHDTRHQLSFKGSRIFGVISKLITLKFLYQSNNLTGNVLKYMQFSKSSRLEANAWQLQSDVNTWQMI